jgi:hypothetical protein
MAFTINGTSGLTFPNATQQATAAFSGANTNAVSSSAITLSSSSPQYQVAQISSFTNSYLTMPDATQLGTGSNPYVIENRSPYGANLELRNNAGTTIGYIPIGQIATVQLKDASTAAGQWVVELAVPQSFFSYNGSSITTVTTTPTPFSTPNYYFGIVGLSSTIFVRWWSITSGGVSSLYTQVGSISGSTITFGAIQSSSILNNGTAAITSMKVVRLSNTAFVVMVGQYYTFSYACCVPGQGAAIRILVCTVSGTVVTFGTPSAASMPQVGSGAGVANAGGACYLNGNICRISDTVFALVYNDAVTSSYTFPYNYSGLMSCQIVSVSGTTMTIGAKATLATSTYSQVLSVVGLSATSVLLCYGQATATGGSAGRSKLVVISVSGTTATFNTAVSCESTDVPCFIASNVDSNYTNGAVAPSATQAIFTTAYNTGECTVSGTVPTFDSFPYPSRLVPMFLSTSSKAYTSNAYLTVATGGFVTNTPVTDVLQTNLTVTAASPYSPLGAQPTTSFVGYSDASNGYASSSVVILGTTT